jgi:hypothetical protein
MSQELPIHSIEAESVGWAEEIVVETVGKDEEEAEEEDRVPKLGQKIRILLRLSHRPSKTSFQFSDFTFLAGKGNKDKRIDSI